MKANWRKAIVIAAAVFTTVITATPAMASTNVNVAQTKVMAAAKAVALKGIKLNKTTMNLNVGNANTLKVSYNPTNTTVKRNLTWKTSNAKVATVDKNGKVVAKAAGTANITVTCNGKSATCKVTVKNPITKVALNSSKQTLKVGKTAVLSASCTPANTTDSKKVTWTSSNNNVATVSNGKITAKKAGTAKITAKMGSKTATCTVIVENNVTIVQPAGSKFVNTNECYSTLNTYRKNAKLGNLTKDAYLESLAKMRATELIKKFSHTRPNGAKGLSVIPGNVYKGENIAKGQRSCAAVMKAWYNSSGHKANMLSKNYTKVGIAGIEYQGTFYWVQLFSN